VNSTSYEAPNGDLQQMFQTFFKMLNT